MPHVNVNGVNLYYEETGTGEPVVFVHEYAGDYRSWEHQVRFFSRRFRCITFNVRGYPPSEVPQSQAEYSQDIILTDIAELLKSLKVKKAHMVGLSMGSYTTLLFGLRYPEVCKSLVVAGTGYGAMPESRPGFFSDIDELSAKFESGGGEAKSTILSNTQSRRPLKLKNPRAWQEFADQLKDHSGKGSALTFRGVQKSRPTFPELEKEFRAMKVPLLLMVGDDDLSSFEGTLFVKRLSPTAGLCVVPQTGHTLNLEEPELFNTEVDRFITLVEAGKWGVRDPRELAAKTTVAAG